MSITPTKAAYEILKVWYATHPEDERFPVDCRAIATELGIKVHGDDLGEEFQGALFIEDGLKAIIYNENIREEGRKNFTVAHELGHYSVHKDKKELRCSMADLNDFGTGPHPANIEQEANYFAANLLMPAADFRTQLKGKSVTLGLAGNLKTRYKTTLTATALRILEISSEPLALIRVKNGRVEWPRRNDRMAQTGLWLRKGDALPTAALTGNRDGHQVNASLWLDERHADRWAIIQSIVEMPSYGQTLVLLHAISREYEKDVWDDVKDTVDLMPRW